jgi:hypothetical protein
MYQRLKKVGVLFCIQHHHQPAQYGSVARTALTMKVLLGIGREIASGFGQITIPIEMVPGSQPSLPAGNTHIDPLPSIGLKVFMGGRSWSAITGDGFPGLAHSILDVHKQIIATWHFYFHTDNTKDVK